MEINSGIDLIEVNRLKNTYKNFGNRFLTRIYDPTEIDQFNKRSKRAKPNFLAKNFAAKEAVSKVLGVGFSQGVRPKDIVVLRVDQDQIDLPTTTAATKKHGQQMRVGGGGGLRRCRGLWPSAIVH